MPNMQGGPFSLNYGNVPVFSSAQLTSTFTCVDDPFDEGISWTITITGPNAADFTVVADDGGASVGSPGIVTIQFTPSAAGARTATVTYDHTGTNTPRTGTLSGTGAAGGFLTLIPQTVNDFGSVKDGTPSTPLNVLAINNSGTNVIVTAIAFNGDFTAGPGQPGLPFTLLANNASGSTVIPVIFTPSVTGFKVTTNAVEVTSNATNNPTDQAMQGTGVIINSVFSISLAVQAVLMAFVLNGVIVIKEMNVNDLDCEESASFKRIYDWGSPLMEKYLGRVVLRYEDASVVPFDFTVTGRAPRSPSPVSVSVINQGGANDNLIHNVFADLQISDDLIEVQVSRAADDGPLVITEIFHEVEQRGEVIEAA
jgi:hypothetical protein